MDKDLEHLIYDGMAVRKADGTIEGSVRPTKDTQMRPDDLKIVTDAVNQSPVDVNALIRVAIQDYGYGGVLETLVQIILDDAPISDRTVYEQHNLAAQLLKQIGSTEVFDEIG